MVDAQLNVNLFDAIVIGVLFLSCMLSFFRGFIRELMSLFAWVGAAFLTLYLVMDVAELLKPYVKKPEVALIFASLGTYFTSLVIISILSSIMMRYIKPGADVGSLDHILGLVFGFLKGSIIIVLGYFLTSLAMTKEDYPDWMKTAYSLPYVEKGTEIMITMMPDYLKGITSMADKAKNGEPVDFTMPFSKDSTTKPADAPGFENDDVKALERLLNGSGEDEPTTPKVVTP